MAKFEHHLFVCCNTRDRDHRRGSCDPDARGLLRSAFKSELKRAGLASTSRANFAGCLDQCEHGPVVAIYPQNIWYGNVTREDVPRIVQETLLKGLILDDLQISDDCLNNPNCPHRAEG